jgi:alkylation response protein AidB-like acyl-CoA dehydrogenase
MHQGIPSRTVILDDAGIPADRLIGADGTDFKTALATLNHDRITIAGQALGIAQGALNYAAGYVKERRQFGQAIADFHGVQFMLADTAMKLEAACQLTYHAAAVLGEAMACCAFSWRAKQTFSSFDLLSQVRWSLSRDGRATVWFLPCGAVSGGLSCSAGP